MTPDKMNSSPLTRAFLFLLQSNTPAAVAMKPATFKWFSHCSCIFHVQASFNKSLDFTSNEVVMSYSWLAKSAMININCFLGTEKLHVDSINSNCNTVILICGLSELKCMVQFTRSQRFWSNYHTNWGSWTFRMPVIMGKFRFGPLG